MIKNTTRVHVMFGVAKKLLGFTAFSLLSLHASTALALDDSAIGTGFGVCVSSDDLPFPVRTLAAGDDAGDREELAFSGDFSDDDLENKRGAGLGPNVKLNLNNLSAISTGNTLNNVRSGSNYIDAGAFSGNVGVTTGIVNTGNSATVQSATTINIYMQ